ncbi:hypothetical protein HDV03_005253 [Kappamyces sp. JEL0829]|nr:hypothetical protein HDV03_005253 [Kappamyces sp. JEL0829]
MSFLDSIATDGLSSRNLSSLDNFADLNSREEKSSAEIGKIDMDFTFSDVRRDSGSQSRLGEPRGGRKESFLESSGPVNETRSVKTNEVLSNLPAGHGTDGSRDIFASGSGLLSQATSRRTNKEKPSAAKDSLFEDLDLSDMLGLNDKDSPKRTLPKSDVAANARDEPASILARQSSPVDRASTPKTRSSSVSDSDKNGDDDLPSFLRGGSLGGPSDGRRRGGRGMGSFSLQNQTASTTKPAEVAASPSEPKKISIFDILDKKPAATEIRGEARNPETTPSILDILGKNIPPLDSTASPKRLQDSHSDSLSSIAALSDDSDDEKPASPAAPSQSAPATAPSSASAQQISSLTLEIQTANELVQSLRQALAAAEEKCKDHQTTEASLQRLHQEEIKKLMLDHDTTVSRLKADVEAASQQSASIKADYERKLETQQHLHLEELKRMASTADGTQKLNSLVGQVENTTSLIEKLQSQIDEANDESLRCRENAVALKEVHLARIEEQLQAESKILQKERLSVEQLLLDIQEKAKFQELIQQQNVEQYENESAKLKREIEQYEKLKDSLSYSLQQSRDSFYRESELWQMEKSRLLDEINTDRKEVSLAKATLASQERILQLKKDEWMQKEKNERQQLEAERRVVETEQRDLAHRFNTLHREETLLKAERMRLQEKQREIETATAIYQKEEFDLEQKYCEISALREEAFLDREQAQNLRKGNESLQKSIETRQSRIMADLALLEEKKKSFIDLRIAKSLELQSRLRMECRHAPRETGAPSTPLAMPLAPPRLETTAPRTAWSSSERDDVARLEMQLETSIAKQRMKQKHVLSRTRLPSHNPVQLWDTAAYTE